MKWHPFGPLLAGSAGALLIGCSVGPAYHRPDIAAPAQWREAAAGSGAEAVWPAADWWHGFGSAKLDELIAEAQRNNDDLAAAVARVQEADAQARIAGAALLPSLDLGATATRERARTPGNAAQVFNSFNPELTASYEIDFWGKNRALRNAARAAAAASRYDQQTIALTVVSSVATTYFQALELRDRIQVAQQNLDNGQTILRGFRARTIRRHRDGARCGAAGDRRRGAECRAAAAAAAISPDRVCARRAHRQDSGVGRCRHRHAGGSVQPGGRRGLAVPAPDPPSGCGRGGTAVDRRQRGYHRGPGGVVSQHPAHRERRLRKHGTDFAHQSAESRLCADRRG